MGKLCDICHEGRVPRRNNVMTFLYLGSASCMQFWIAGRRGLIPDHMCDVVRYLSRTVCGCEEVKPNASLQAVALDMVGGVQVPGREPIYIPKSSAQLASEAAFAAYRAKGKV